PLWANAAFPTKGWWRRFPTLAISATYPERAASFFICPSGRTPRFILTARQGMIEQRFAFPHRSPYPLIVPWTWVAPLSTAAREVATAISESLWVWIPSGRGVVFPAPLTVLTTSAG